jgi:genome maintenance exonuclease 1
MTYSTKELIEFISARNQHLYRRCSDGMPIPGVTSILKVIAKPALIQWAANKASDYWRAKALEFEGLFSDKVRELVWAEAKKAHRDFSTGAANIGTEVHAYAEASLKGQTLPQLTTDEARRGVEAFERWRADHNIELGTSERICFSQNHWYAGTCDFVGRIDGENCVADFKTASGIYPEMRLQLAAYQQAIVEETGQNFPARWIIRFDKKTGEFEAKPFRTDFTRDFEAFLSALNLHKTLKQIEEDSR